MKQFTPIKLEEHAGHKFYVEHVASIPSGTLYRVHLTNGTVHNLTIGYATSEKDAKETVIQEFKNYLDTLNNNQSN
ncbi:hypothetical protein C0966_16985 (plasmid) [Bacillus methanolicus]|uniref:hypothetical protein n=1 Tax=Bacillus methanolicus TaxID=1471 RepID=UPI002380AB7B|nr:hypothetical protein [Bacillus methanolicus]MDE3840962.1 hypothetical protein [Bacillus methanolicus]